MGERKFSYFGAVKSKFKIKNHLSYMIVAAIAIILVIASSVSTVKSSTLYLFEEISINVILAVSLSLVVGFLGELSLGHAGFMSVGAFTGCVLCKYVFPSLAASSPLAAILISVIAGGLTAAAFGFLIGLPALRLKGDYLAIVTLAFGEIIKVVFQNINALGGALGFSHRRYDKAELYIICFVLVILTIVVLQNFIKSKHGRAVMAIRDNEIAARATGVNVTPYKIFVFVLSAFFAGIAGVLYANSQNNIQAVAFDYNKSIDILVMVVLGGMGNTNGSIVSAFVITLINNRLQTKLTGNLAALKNLVYALILIILVIYNNAPHLKKFREKFSFKKLFASIREKAVKLFRKREKAHDPSVEKEFGADWSKIPTKVEMDAVLSTDITKDITYVPDKPDKPSGNKEEKP